MARFNTGNTVDSKDPRDLSDNAQNIDQWSNSEAASFPDRLGVQRRTLKGMDGEFQSFLDGSAYDFLGDYAAGIEVASRNQVIREAGEFWRASAGTELPYTTTGAGMPEAGAFVSVGDAVLRQDLAGANGLDFIGGTGTAAARNIGTGPEDVPDNSALDSRGFAQSVASVEALRNGSFANTLEHIKIKGDTEEGGLVYADRGDTTTIDDGKSVYVDADGVRWKRSKISLNNVPQAAAASTLTQVSDVAVTGPDLLKKLMASTNVRGMHYRPTTQGVAVGVNMGTNMVAEYRFKYDPDDLLLLRGVWIGPENPDARKERPTLSGTFNTASAPSAFTSTPGDSFSFSFTGQSFKFTRICESRGGYWRFTVLNAQGVPVQAREVSCYRDGGATTQTSEVIAGLPFASYTVVATFKGDDPSFPPSSSPSRGYVHYDPNDPEVKAIDLDRLKQLDFSQQVDVLSAASIPDFAIRGRVNGATYDRTWVPAHTGSAGASQNILMKILINGVNRAASPGAIPSLAFQEIESFEIIQQFSARNLNAPTVPMWLHTISHSFDKSGALDITQTMRMSEDVDIDDAYFTMMPVEQSPADLDRIVLNNGFVKRPVPADGSVETFGFDVSSAAALGEFSPGNYYGVSMTVDSMREMASFGRKYQPDVPGLITYRTDNVTKIYWRFAQNTVLESGDTLGARARIAVCAGIVSPNVDALTVSS